MFERVDYLGIAGQMADTLIPKGWSIASTELNAFGFFIKDREVLDLWGYTNRRIAESNTLNSYLVKNDPGLFMRIQPDTALIWYVYQVRESFPAKLSYEELVAKGAYANNLAKVWNQFGDLFKVIDHYDVFRLAQAGRDFVFLVKKDKSLRFLDALKTFNYTLEFSRSLDREKITELYNRQTLTQHFI